MRFRRREEETYNEQMLREAGLDRPQQPEESEERPEQQPEPLDSYAGTYPAQQQWLGAYTRAIARPEEWDVYTTADAPEIAGDAVEFAALPEGDLIVDEEQGDADLSPLAEAVEKHLQPPYRAVARREEHALWGVAARTIDVRRLDCAGEELELVVREAERTLTIDGVPAEAGLPELAQEGDYAASATRLDGDLWEVRVERL